MLMKLLMLTSEGGKDSPGLVTSEKQSLKFLAEEKCGVEARVGGRGTLDNFATGCAEG